MSAPQLVKTIKERCRVCYTCVRECPAKAIRIAEGQAEVIPERCIGCGNCVSVCSQGAKQVLDCKTGARALLGGKRPVAALLAPSFPVEFTECDWRHTVGMLRKLGFASVHEVGFGADLVALRYRRLLNETRGRRYIATSCPAVVGYVERYHPELLGSLAPIVSPMIATARALRRLKGEEQRFVFIGPCVAKKGEAVDRKLTGEIDAVLTFEELREMLDEEDITPFVVEPADLDPPAAGRGALFPVSRGLFHAADVREDLSEDLVVAADGRIDFLEAMKEFGSGDLQVRLLEVLACKGCISGPCVRRDEPLFSRRRRVTDFAKERGVDFDRDAWSELLCDLSDLDLTRSYTSRDNRTAPPDETEIRRILNRMGKPSPEEELNCGACGYETCREHSIAILEGLAETEMCLPYTIDRLHVAVDNLAESNRRLASTREALAHSEKLASMGQLAAGIAHEVNNPLGVVLMYAHLLHDEHAGDPRMREDLVTIAREADRCKKIVAGLLDFARQTKVLRKGTDVYEIVQSTAKALPPPPGVELQLENEAEDSFAEVDGDQIAQVLTNLVSNAYGATGRGGVVTVRIDNDEHKLRIIVTDTGVGIPKENISKIFEPFFTTKQIGKGTGLGLAVTYGIVKMHNGDIQVRSNADPDTGPTGTTVTVTLPRRAPERTKGAE
ncbi:MAG: [Fe-Fe] hydrogenase large subunit C-terminal domain-containing protein [Myxococcota bacterium]